MWASLPLNGSDQLAMSSQLLVGAGAGKKDCTGQSGVASSSDGLGMFWQPAERCVGAPPTSWLSQHYQLVCPSLTSLKAKCLFYLLPT